jgi:hypothetical protein
MPESAKCSAWARWQPPHSVGDGPAAHAAIAVRQSHDKSPRGILPSYSSFRSIPRGRSGKRRRHRHTGDRRGVLPISRALPRRPAGRPSSKRNSERFKSDIAFYLVLGFAALVGGALYWIALESAVATVIQHRERILHDLSNTDGPIVGD